MNGTPAVSEAQPPAVSVRPDAETRPAKMNVLKKRSEFLACARARKAHAPAFLLQARKRQDDSAALRVGFTASKKVGNAVARNRAKRRLRALAQNILLAHGTQGYDYVLVARREATATRPMEKLEVDLMRALKEVHAPRRPRNPD